MALRHCSTLRSHLLDERRRYHTQQVIWRWRPSQMTATQRCTEMEGRRRWLRLSAGLKQLLPGHWRISSFEPRNIGCVLPGTFKWRIYLLGCDTQRVGNQRAYLLCLLLIWLGQKACSTLARPYPAYCIRYHKFTTGNCCHATPPLSLSTPSKSSSVSLLFAASRSLRRTRHRN